MYPPLDLDDPTRREIPPFVKFHGWHAFRRGLGTGLYEIAMRDIDIQALLHHADVSTTKAYYIKPSERHTRVMTAKFAKVARTKYGIK